MSSDYYGPQAYRPDQIPPQRRQIEDRNRSWFNKKLDMRLPWGNTQEVAPFSLQR